MKQSVHGHEVMQMMLKQGQPFTKDTLCLAIIEEFGEDSRFHTCSSENMTANELVEFLSEKGKFVEKAEGFNTSAAKICDH